MSRNVHFGIFLTIVHVYNIQRYDFRKGFAKRISPHGCRWSPVVAVTSCVGDTISDMTLATLTLALAVSLSAVRGQSFGPVDLEAVDPLSLSWNQIHWLVRDQIKEVEELKAEHDEIYNEIAGESNK